MFHTWLRALPVIGVDQNTLHTYLHQLDQLEQEVLRIEGDLSEQVEQGPYGAPVKVLLAFRGIGLVTALTFVLELGDLRRFAVPRQLMAYLSLVPSEHSSGAHTQRGGITKTGNTHARKALVSAAWKYAHPPRSSRMLQQRQKAISSPESSQISMYREYSGRTEIRWLSLGSITPGNSVNLDHQHTCVYPDLWRSDWHGRRTHAIPLR